MWAPPDGFRCMDYLREVRPLCVAACERVPVVLPLFVHSIRKTVGECWCVSLTALCILQYNTGLLPLLSPLLPFYPSLSLLIPAASYRQVKKGRP